MERIEGGSGKDVLLLDGTLKDYAIQVTKTGGTDHGRCGRDGYRVKGVELFRFLSDGTAHVTSKTGGSGWSYALAARFTGFL